MKKVLFLILVMIGIFQNVKSQTYTEQEYKAIFMTNIIRHIGWDESVTTSGDFVIGIVKNDALYKKLKELAKGKKIGYQNIVIEQFPSVDVITDCHVLFVSSSVNFIKYCNKINNIVGNNTLIITEVDGMTSYGSLINFVIKDDILKFEINKKNIISHGMHLNSKLEAMTSSIVID